jgi:hypothetical protein
MTSEPFDSSTKAFYRYLFENWGMAVETEREVFFRGRSIDLVVTCTESDRSRLQNTVFSHFRQINAVELKGIHDPLTVIDYNRIMMRVWGLGALKSETSETDESAPDTDVPDDDTDDDTDDDEADDSQLNRLPSRRTLTIVCLTKPIKILNQLKEEFQFVKTSEEGVYRCQIEEFSRWIICPSELALAEKNYPLLPLARGEKLAQFISLCLRDGLIGYLQLIIDIGLATDPKVIWEKILEMKQMKPKIPEEAIPHIDRYFRVFPEEMWKISIIREALAESEWRGHRAAIRQGAQQTLIRQLQRKFTTIPNSVVQKIEATENIDQLDNWLLQVIAADSLANTGLLSADKA